MKIILTGAGGFVGGHLLRRLLDDGFTVTAAVRNDAAKIDSRAEAVMIDGVSHAQDWSEVLAPEAVVIHAAARAHVMNDNAGDPLSRYREVNTAGTLSLARQAAAAGVKRFVFVSSIKVNGESTTAIPAFTEADQASSVDPYAISKIEAEEGLQLIAKKTSMEIVIIRPPLVYGPRVKANFLNLMRLASTAAPLPFGAINNKRSMIYVANFVDFIVHCTEHPAAANQTFLISDGRDLSLRDLLTQLRLAMGTAARLIPVPMFFFSLAGKILGKQALADRLVGDLQVDPSKANKLLAWTPPYTVEVGIQATVDEFLKSDK